MKTSAYFYHDKPLFGIDIGYSTIKVMQTKCHGHKDNKQREIVGYGVGSFDSVAVKDGVIVDYESIAKSFVDLFKNNIVGKITTRRVAITIPATRAYTRTLHLPVIDNDQLGEAVMLEMEQYIPVQSSDLYIDYVVINRNDKEIEILAVAVPKKIIESHTTLIRLLGLEPVAIDTSILAAGRLFEKEDEHRDVPAVIIDFGSMSADITIHDKTIIVTGTIPCGGDIFTDLIMEKLGVAREEAHLIKTKYGVSKSKKQAEILDALKPSLDQLTKEIRRMIRYHEERSGANEKIGQVVTMGGGANMPGLSEYLTSVMRTPVRMCDPWQNFTLHRLQPPSTIEKSMYVTVAGLSIIEPKELFVS